MYYGSQLKKLSFVLLKLTTVEVHVYGWLFCPFSTISYVVGSQIHVVTIVWQSVHTWNTEWGVVFQCSNSNDYTFLIKPWNYLLRGIFPHTPLYDDTQATNFKSGVLRKKLPRIKWHAWDVLEWITHMYYIDSIQEYDCQTHQHNTFTLCSNYYWYYQKHRRDDVDCPVAI